MITLASQRYTIAAYGGTLDSRYPEGDGIGTLYPELPRYTVDTTYSLPTGNTWTATVTANNNAAGTGTGNRTDCGLQYALTNSARNDVIVLTAGATYTGNFTCPAKTGTGWIYVISSALANLPAGVRVVAGDAADMAKIVRSSTHAFSISASASHWRFCGLEITDAGDAYYGDDMIRYPDGGGPTTTPSYIIADRCWMHGNATYGSGNAFTLSGAHWAVINCRLNDIGKNAASGQTAEKQAIVTYGFGPYLIHNNFIEAAGENVLTGGATNPPDVNLYRCSDVTITGNHFYLPESWKASEATFPKRTVKNLLEFKTGQRMLVEGNLFENLWSDQGQAGFALVLTTRNQSGNDPDNYIRDLTVRYNRFKNVSSGVNILCTDDEAGPSRSMQRIWIHDNEFTLTGIDCNGGTNGDRRAFQFNPGTKAGVFSSTDGLIGSDIRITHNTVYHTARTKGATVQFIKASVDIGSVYYRDNLLDYGAYGVISDSINPGTTAIAGHVTTYEWTHNVLFAFAGTLGNYPGGTNYYPALEATVAFTNAGAGNYLLSGASPYKNAASDGADIGCNIAAMEAELND